MKAYEAELKTYEQAIQTYQQQLAQWQEEVEESYEALDAAIHRYNHTFAENKIRDWTQYDITRTVKESVVVQSNPGQILSGGDLHLVSSGSLINDKSKIIAGETITGDLNRLENIDAKGKRIVQDVGTSQYTSNRWRGGIKRYHQRNWDSKQAYNPAAETSTILLSVVEQSQHTKLQTNASKAGTLSKASNKNLGVTTHNDLGNIQQKHCLSPSRGFSTNSSTAPNL